MVPIEELSPGVRVKIVDQWGALCNQNPSGHMDKYLGQIVTVFDVRISSVIIEEDAGDCESHDGGHWYWNCYCFDHIVEDGPQEDFEISSRSEILSLLYGN